MAGAPPANIDLTGEIARVSTEIDTRFETLLPLVSDPRARLYAAMRHGAIGGGKRLRPLLLLATSAIFHVDRHIALRAACAVEAMHVYSLIHDDLPAMDDDDMRRGKPTVHREFDEATAILAGDALLTMAFQILSDPDSHSDPFIRSELVLTLARAGGADGMVGGQMMDIEAENARFDLATVTRLQAMKTGALISASVEMGAILGHVPPEGRHHLRAYARDIGLAFQICDDLLDVEGEAAKTGKAVKKDAEAGKATFLSLMGLDRAREQAVALIDQAVGHLSSYGAEADLLRAIARYILERDR